MDRDSARHVLWVILDFHPDFTGHGIYLTKLERVLRTQGYRFTVVTRNPDGRWPADEQFGNVRVRRLPMHGNSSMAFLAFCLRLVGFAVRERQTFDVVHLHGFYDRFGVVTLFKALFGKRLITQLVAYHHDDPETYLGVYSLPWLRRRLLRGVDAFVCISTPLAQSCVDVGVDPRRVHRIYQGVDVHRFEPVESAEAKSAIRRNLGLGPSAPVCIYVGAILVAKGVRDLLDAWTEVQRAVPDATLLMVGPYAFGDDDAPSPLDELIHELRATVAERGLDVRFPGRVDDVETWMRASDVFVFASHREGFGNVIIEAMACRLPCVVTPMDGVGSDSVVDGETGFIADGVENFARAVTTLLGDAALRESMGNRGRARAEAVFALPHIADQYAAVYADLTEADS